MLKSQTCEIFLPLHSDCLDLIFNSQLCTRSWCLFSLCCNSTELSSDSFNFLAEILRFHCDHVYDLPQYFINFPSFKRKTAQQRSFKYGQDKFCYILSCLQDKNQRSIWKRWNNTKRLIFKHSVVKKPLICLKTRFFEISIVKSYICRH